MIHSSKLLRAPVVLIACIATISFTGCANKQGILDVDAFADVQAGAVPEPVGTKVCQWQTAQTQQAAKDQAVLYKADFIGQSEALAPSATDKIVQALRNGTASSQVWMVEPSGDSYRDSIRLNSVRQLLVFWGVPNPQVGTGIPAALGMPGVLAESNFRNSGVNNNQRNTTTTQNQFLGF